MMRPKLGLYIHLPFCAHKCPYCDFYSGPFGPAETAAYQKALLAEMERRAPAAADYTVDSIFLGGGTPTLVPEIAAAALDRAAALFHIAPDCEITTEANPSSAMEEVFRLLAASGVNRISLGLQSADDRELSRIGRTHRYADFLKALDAARAAGVDNIGADLMFGLPKQKREDFQRTLEKVTALGLAHLSCYALTLAEGTPFYKLPARVLPNGDQQSDMYHDACTALRAAGFVHYEISNYAQPGRESRHNLRYWTRSPYLGFGASAHSFFGGLRFASASDLASYCAGAEPEIVETLDERDAMDETVMLGFRLARGFDEDAFRAAFGKSPEEAYPALSRFLASGHAVRENHHLHLTEDALFISNAILSEIL